MKDQIQNYFEDLLVMVAEKEVCAIEAFSEITAVKKRLSEIAEKIKEYVIMDAEGYFPGDQDGWAK